jgi:hypothetical protein
MIKYVNLISQNAGWIDKFMGRCMDGYMIEVLDRFLIPGQLPRQMQG